MKREEVKTILKTENRMRGFICGPRIYEFNEIIFEYNPYIGPWPLTKNWEPRKRAGRKFFKLFGEFIGLPEQDQEKYRLGGGCVQF